MELKESKESDCISGSESGCECLQKNLICISGEVFIVLCRFRNLPHRVGASKSDILLKGVIEILSFIIELGGLNCNKDKVDNSTYFGCLYPAEKGRLYSNIGVGLLFYLLQRYAKT